MSIRVDVNQLIPNSFTIGNNGLGVKGIDLPVDGQDGNSILYELANLPSENDVEFRMLVTSQPSGDLATFEDGSFIYDGSTSSFNIEWFKDGISQGIEAINVQVGTTTGVNIDVNEAFNGFSESIIANITVTGELNVAIVEVFGGFSELIGVNAGSTWIEKQKVNTNWTDK